MNGLRADVIQDSGAFDDLEPHWWPLWTQCASATPFQSPAWLLPWWRTFAPGDLSAIAVWSGNDLVGLAPLYLERHASGSRLLPIGISLSDYLDVLCLPELKEAVGTAIAETVLSLEWVQWILPNLPAEAVSLDLVLPGIEESLSTGHAACPVLALSGGETITGSVPARRRRQLRRALRAAQRRGRVTITRAETAPGMFLGHLIRLHKARWAGQGGGVLTQSTVEFHRDALPRLAARHLARCWVVEIDGAVVGAYYGFHHRSRAYAYLGGFDPAYAQESPGAILIGKAIAEAVQEDAREFDFLRGRESYKYCWGQRTDGRHKGSGPGASRCERGRTAEDRRQPHSRGLHGGRPVRRSCGSQISRQSFGGNQCGGVGGYRAGDADEGLPLQSLARGCSRASFGQHGRLRQSAGDGRFRVS
ncbi:GNAT family N-acetyltransferase [Mesorhizobium sp. ORM6]